jgi:creatinine amidohydrolase/Fe(II)-dependent formamide hydrolase-like protein
LAGFAALECSVVQWLEMDENPKFHRKLIETDSMLLIDKMLIATRNLDEPNQFDQDDLDQNVMETKPPVEG